jgi:omega-amidase
MNDKSLTISYLQSNIVWHDKAANLQHFEQLIKKMDKPCHVLLLPEMFSTGFTNAAAELAEDMNGITMQWLTKMAKQQGCIISGTFIAQENNQFYNRLVWMQPNGTYYTYNKRHLFSMAQEHNTYTAGDSKLIVQVNGIKICLNTCYDLRFPVWSRQQKGNEYDVLIYLANWPQARIYAWDSLLVARAIENQAYVIGVNRVGNDGNNIVYNGHSQIIDPMGSIICKEDNQERIQSFNISLNELETIRKNFPFLNDADGFKIEI